MKKLTAFVLVVMLGALAQAQTTLIQRFDMRRGDHLSVTTGLLFKGGLEVWSFGYDRKETMDLEIGGAFYARGPWTVSAYAVWWPNTQDFFVLPWVNYSSKFLNGNLSLNVAEYVPITGGGPHLPFTDPSKLLWDTKTKGIAAGIGMSGVNDRLQFGPQVDCMTNIGLLSFRALFPTSGTPGSFRFEFATRF